MGRTVIGAARKASAAVGTTRKDTPEREEHGSASFPVVVGDGPTANVNVNMGATIGLPEYSNAKCGVSLTIPADADESSIERAFEYAKRWCEEKQQALIDEINAENG